MKTFNNFKSTADLNSTQQAKLSVLYIEDENGLDWYEALKQFKPNTMKIVFDSEENIVSFSQEADRLFPVGCSVAELAMDDIPEGLKLGPGWLFKDGEIAPKPIDYIAEAEYEKEERLAEANIIIPPLQDAVDLNMATEAEIERLHQWKAYRVLLSRVDTSTAPNINWPQKPAS